MSFESAFHSLVDELDLADHVKARLHEEADVSGVPDVPPDKETEEE